MHFCFFTLLNTIDERYNAVGENKKLIRTAVYYSVAICAAVFIFFSPAQGQVYVGGELMMDANYTPENNPYIVTQDLIVRKNVTLTLQPGVVMLFEYGTSIISNGTLIAKGLPGQKINFLPKNPLSLPGQWSGIVFNNAQTVLSSDSSYVSGSILSEVLISKASYSVSLANSTSMLIEKSTFVSSAFGIYITGSGYNTIRQCYFDECDFGIYIANGFKNPGQKIYSNYFYNSADVGIFINSDAMYSNHNFIQNNDIRSSGIGLHIGNYTNIGAGYNMISGNIFIDNKEAVKLFQQANTISNNYFILNRNGLECWQSDKNIISQNLFSRNLMYAITLDAGSSYNNFTSNSINFNSGGVLIKADSARSSLLNNFSFNTVYNNSDFSFQIENPYQGLMRNNNIGSNGNLQSFINLNDSLLHAENNFWGTSVFSRVDSIIFDLFDEPLSGEVFYKPVLEALSTEAPVPPPGNVIKQLIGNNVIVRWDDPGLADLEGYNVNYGSTNGINYANTIRNGENTTINMGHFPIKDTIAVTALDFLSDGFHDQTEGHESDFSYAVLVPYAGPDTAICKNSNYTISKATAPYYKNYKWSTSGDGKFDNDSFLHPVYSPGTNDYLNGYAKLYLHAESDEPQSAGFSYTDAATITFQDAPQVFAGRDTSIVSDSALWLGSAYASNYAFLRWVTSGDGNFSVDTLSNPTYNPGSGDINAGSVILTFMGFSSCGSSVDQVKLNIAPGYSIKGRIHAGTSPAVNSNISLFLDNKGSIEPVRSVYRSIDGNFEMKALFAGTYYLYVLPDKLSNPGFLPTYYFNDIHWGNAYKLELKANTYDVDIDLAKSSVQLPDGKASIHGYSTSVPGSENCGDVTVMLYDKQMKNILDWVRVTNGGNFIFNNLPYGEYILAGEKVGIQVFQSDVILVSPTQPDAKNIELVCSPAAHKFSLPGYLNPEKEQEKINVFPNPLLEYLYISGLTENGTYSVRLVNTQGNARFLYPAQTGSENHSYYIGALPPGFYILEIYRDNEILSRQKLVKQ
ncbi:MAG: right-handed parallel beta-helix repeat-containing protein [Bacteroidota bacterium]